MYRNFNDAIILMMRDTDSKIKEDSELMSERFRQVYRSTKELNIERQTMKTERADR